MSGLVGVFQRDTRELDPAALARMTAVMAHRGPDGSRQWRQGPIGLGHCMMHTTPESLAEIVPGVDEESGLSITSDARIDNRDELISSLHLRRQGAASISDSQLILQAYRKWKTACVHHLIGDFAFLIWDQQAQHMFAARDHLGVKPLYYHLSDKLFAAATEVRSVCGHPQVPQVRNETRVADYLVNQMERIDTSSTFFEHIQRLPAAHTLTVSRERVSVEKYWQLDPQRQTRFGSDAEYTEAFREVYTEAIRARLRCNGNAAAMLSGGIDSASLTALARDLRQREGGAPFRIYSGIADDEQTCTDSIAIREIIAAGGLDPHLVRPAEMHRFEPRLRALFERVEEPFDNHMTINQVLYLVARSQGDRVILDGVEGDLAHSLGGAYPALLLREGRLFKALRETLGLWYNRYNRDSPMYSVARESLVPAFIPDWLRHVRQRLLARSRLAGQLEGSSIHPDFCRRARVSERLHQSRRNAHSGFPSSLRQQHIGSVTDPALPAALERYNRVAALCGVEPRHPLLDKRLVELSVSFPWDQKVRDGWRKLQLHRVTESALPQSVAWRRSWADLGWDFTRQRMDLLGNAISHTCANMSPELERYVATEALRLAREKRRYCRDDTLNEAIWNIYSLAVWSSHSAPTT